MDIHRFVPFKWIKCMHDFNHAGTALWNLEAVTALAFQSGTLLVGFEDGQVKILRPGCDPLMADAFHSSQVQELQLLSDDLFMSSCLPCRRDHSVVNLSPGAESLHEAFKICYILLYYTRLFSHKSLLITMWYILFATTTSLDNRTRWSPKQPKDSWNLLYALNRTPIEWAWAVTF